jgi:hypothetical protein
LPNARETFQNPEPDRKDRKTKTAFNKRKTKSASHRLTLLIAVRQTSGAFEGARHRYSKTEMRKW